MVPLTTIILVGSKYKALYRHYRDPTRNMVLAVEGKDVSSGAVPLFGRSHLGRNGAPHVLAGM